MPTTEEPDPTPPPTLDMELMRRMADLQMRKRQLKEESKENERAIAELQEACRDAMEEAGVLNLPLQLADGTRLTLFIHHQIYARPIGGSENKPAVVEALRAEGMDDFVKTDCNLNQISAFARECARGEAEMPSRLEAVLDLNETVEVRSRVR